MTNDLIEYCSLATEREDFVGIRFDFDAERNKHRPYITFPYGYNYTSNDDILCLVSVLADYQRELQDIGMAHMTEEEKQGFPLQSYMFVIQDYLSNGYYIEREAIHASRNHGKVNWGRTVKKEKPVIQDNGAIYLNLQTRLHHSNDEHIMTEISKHSVYESFSKLGWYYGLSAPAKPFSTLKKTQFIAILRDKLHKANKDMDKQLFQSMINVLESADEDDKNPHYFTFGTRRFEKVWEKLIEKAYGTEFGDSKKMYFPVATWVIDGQEVKDTNRLLPDTIMKNPFDGILYVIDAKYYKYGVKEKRQIKDLPGIASITKQIIYAEYIASLNNMIDSPDRIRNVFILPFNGKEHQSHYSLIGLAKAEWFASIYDYTNIYTVLVDTKHLMKNKKNSNFKEMKSLSEIIKNSKNHLSIVS